MKKRYIYKYNAAFVDLYFSTPKKAHKYLLEHCESVHKTFAGFNRWLTQDGIYQLSSGNAIYQIELL